ncbi:nicotinate-nucleotide--dimethylbenzimidazole phosphoribosyltransferase [Rubellimicrobium sp. CFH 75288]|uniref:nicotinate-nucleotide--dimethylbenzimidazole phosphoribosyltransferase n=1 Tax=Rubellimicrobium sp. CFH 75288 TaxID=2697034 RepID=UPI00141293A9|nr:nicotinate-nucleotide--dimethylbenzimidazole phosphoribosyltransferase [Rubellimicrobium sp. CFH 75288]
MMPPFSTLQDFRALLQGAPAPDPRAREAALARNAQLTKPPGALGRLEALAIWLAGWQGTDRPAIRSPQVALFAGNHGVVAQGVSAFPAAVTALMVENFARGGAAINRIADTVGAELTVVALDLDRPTADFTTGPAMTETECVAALRTGWEALRPGTDILVTGEMGIGNTTSAAALCAALLDGRAEEWVGRGSGVDKEGLARKARAVQAGLDANPSARGDALEALRCLGGREVAAMAGAMAAARLRGVPVVLDGFICSAAALVLARSAPGALDHAVAGHRSAEAAHGRLLAALGLEPILSLEMRLGEGTGGALALGVLRAACACQSGMATFAEAGIGP